MSISNKNFTTIKDNVANIIGDTSSGFKTKIGVWANRRYRDIVSRYQWAQLFKTYTLTTTANVAEYPLPIDFGELVYVYDNTNKKTLWHREERGQQNDTSLVGSSDYFSLKEATVKEQPSSASVLTVVSDAAGDTTQTIFIEGETISRVLRSTASPA